MIIVNLNIRGIGATKTCYLKYIIAKEGAKFLCLQETKSLIYQIIDDFCYGG